MINTSLINTTLINSGDAGDVYAASDLSCFSTLGPVTSVRIGSFKTNDMHAEALCEATPSVPPKLTVNMVCNAIGIGACTRYTPAQTEMQSKSGMPPTQISFIVTLTGMPMDSSSELSGRFNIYRKGKPAIEFNTYSVRRTGGRIVILKDEYI